MKTTKKQSMVSTIQFEALVENLDSVMLVRVPKNASAKLPSRGLVIAKGTINGYRFQAPLEPDGKKGHWLKVDSSMQKGARVKTGDKVKFLIEVVKDVPEPRVPGDLKKALVHDAEARAFWKDITPLSRWDWIRWIVSTKNPETRKIRIEKAFSKLKTGKRNACCFNRSECTDPSVSKNGVLLEAMKMGK